MVKTYYLKRFWEIDFLRGIAICLMIFYHLFFDLHFFYNLDPLFPFDNWKVLQIITGGLFLTLVGTSAVLKFQKLRNLQVSLIFFSFVKQALFIFFMGFLLTVFTFLFIEGGAILFGILQLIALSLILSYPFLKRPRLALFLCLIIFFVSPFLNSIFDKMDYLLPLGGQQFNFSMLDYYPVFPWFAFVLLGIFIGNLLFKDRQRKFPVLPFQNYRIIRLLSFLGKNSLLIYFLHQPIIFISLAFLFLVLKIN